MVRAVWSVWRWAAASHEGSLANARAAATECSRSRLERAEVDQFLRAREAAAEARAEEA